MNISLRKSCSTLLIFSMLLSVLAISGCKKKQEGSVSDLPEEITADMEWYEASSTAIETNINEAEFEYVTTNVLGCIGDKVIFYTWGQVLSPPMSYVPDIKRTYLHVYDTNGNHSYDLDVKQAIMDHDPEITGLFINDVVVAGDRLRIEVFNVTTESDPYLCREYYMYLDVDSGEINEVEEKVRSGENANYTTEVGHYVNDGWTVSASVVNLPDGSRPNYLFDISSPDGETSHIDMAEDLPFVSVAGLMGHLYLGDGKFVMIVMNYVFEDRFVYIDAATSEVAELSTIEELSWLYEIDDLASYYYYDGFGNASVDADCIKVIDTEAQVIEDYVSFDYSNINRYEAQYMQMVYADEDKIILGGTVYREKLCLDNFGAEYDVEYPTMVILDRTESNPHAGKKVISLASMDGISYPIAEGIREYNDNSSDTFIMIDKRYRYDVVSQDVEFDPETDMETYELEVRSLMMNRLTIDLIAGDGPDIIMGAVGYRQLNDPSVLLDLSEDVDIPDVYTNVMEFSKTDGALYQVPLSFSLEGIIVNREDVPEGQIGFDFDSYNAYVSGPCNGRDPNRMTRLMFMDACLSEMSSIFEQDNGYDYNNAEFAAVAEFVNSQILPDELDQVVIQEYWIPGMEDPYATDYVSIASGLGLLGTTQGQLDERIIMGFPSDQPRGLMIDVDQSVAVSASTDYPDQCRAFVRMMVGDDIQTLFASYSGISVNRAAEETACISFAQRHNDRYNALCEYYTTQNLMDFEYPLCEVDADRLISDMNGYVENAAGLRTSDAAVELIVREEIQPYFAGQKSIEECMEIIENRVELYVEERG